jgi:cytochrome c-type biogenesis protein CcmH
VRAAPILAALLVTAPLWADSGLPPAPLANQALANPAEEAQARALMDTIRCLVCQSQSIADSDADLAGDMRAMIRERVAAGERPEAIRTWLVRRYGAWVSYRPPVDRLTWPLWAAPLFFLALGVWLARGRLRRRR